MSILVVEDSESLADSLRRGLDEEGFLTEVAPTGSAALERLARGNVDGMILDLGLPELDGIEVLRRMRGDHHLAPVLVLTARDAVESRISALDAGADDYVVKPFVFAEVLARLRALLRRAAAPRWAPLQWRNLALHAAEPSAQVDGRVVGLSPRERALLELFMRRRGEVLTRQELLRDAFGYDFDPGTNIVDVHVSHLRRKLAGAQVEIETVRGHGYRLRDRGDGHG